MLMTLQINDDPLEGVYSGDSLDAMEEAFLNRIQPYSSRYISQATRWWNEKARPKLEQGLSPELRLLNGSALHVWIASV